MTELLTTKQVQELLKIDRTTIYRMLNDGRLTGIKVGSQWRFRRGEIDHLLSSSQPAAAKPRTPSEVLPIHCIQSIQNVFSQIAEVGSITTNMEGDPLTSETHCSPFRALILKSASGRKACIESWKRLAIDSGNTPDFAPCHAGLQYARGFIEIDDKPIAMIVAGQFYTTAPDVDEENIRIRRLATVHNISHSKLAQAALQIPRADERMQAKFGIWLKEVAKTFSDIGNERADVLQRLKVISDMSNLETK